MSIVVALKDKDGTCWLACDKQITIGNKKTFLSEGRNKVFDVPDRPGCIIGHVGFLRGINLLETNNNYIDELAYYRKEIDYDYMVNYFVPSVYELFCNAKLVSSEETILDLKGDTFLIADGSIFEVGCDGSVQEVDTYSAIGSGEELALGSLDSTSEAQISITDRLGMAIKAATSNIYCGGGAIIINNKDDKVYQIEF